MKKKSILITGGAGFLGSNLCRLLLEKGNHVICLDNFMTGRKENIDPLSSNSDFEFINHDIVEPIILDVDQIYNLACPASPPHYQKDPVLTFKISAIGTLNMLELAKKNNARMFQASTSEVYGDPEVHPQPESYWGNVNPVGIRSCYDEGKRAAETLCFDYHRHHKTDIRVIRIFNTYGPNMDPKDGRVVSNFIIQALKDINITIYGDGKQTRSFCYVDDLVQGFVKFMNQDDSIGPMNLGNDDEYTMIELAELILQKTGSNSKLIFEDLPKDDPTRRKPDLSLARQIINYNPDYPLSKGLDRTIEYFKQVI